MNHDTDNRIIEPKPTAKADELILARIDAGIDAADNGRFATKEQVEAELARWRHRNMKNSIAPSF
jgi:predicted transcriptional regulator